MFKFKSDKKDKKEKKEDVHPLIKKASQLFEDRDDD
jgi:hypothetical protein